MKRWIELKNRLAGDKKLAVLAGMFCIGLLLLVFSGGSGKKTASGNADYYDIRAEAEAALEARAVKLLSSVDGVGKVRVLVTLDRLQEIEFAENETQGADDRISRTYVTVETGGEKTGLQRTVISPQVRGVAVSCAGGGSPQVRREVVQLLCAAFGVSASRVHVSKLAD